MINQQQLQNIIYSLGYDPSIERCCYQIANFVLQQKKPYFTYHDFLSATGKAEDDAGFADVQRCIEILKSRQIKLIGQAYKYFDDNVVYDVSLEDLQLASINGALSLELRGYADPHYKSKVYVVFVRHEEGNNE